jgi:hypothetical protein
MLHTLHRQGHKHETLSAISVASSVLEDGNYKPVVNCHCPLSVKVVYNVASRYGKVTIHWEMGGGDV